MDTQVLQSVASASRRRQPFGLWWPSRPHGAWSRTPSIGRVAPLFFRASCAWRCLRVRARATSARRETSASDGRRSSRARSANQRTCQQMTSTPMKVCGRATHRLCMIEVRRSARASAATVARRRRARARGSHPRPCRFRAHRPRPVISNVGRSTCPRIHGASHLIHSIRAKVRLNFQASQMLIWTIDGESFLLTFKHLCYKLVECPSSRWRT